MVLALAAAALAATISPQVEAQTQFAYVVGECKAYLPANQLAEQQAYMVSINNDYERGLIEAAYNAGVIHARENYVTLDTCVEHMDYAVRQIHDANP